MSPIIYGIFAAEMGGIICSNTVLVIDGFTRFSAEEEALVTLLNDKCHQIVIGTYASQKGL